MFTGIIEAKCKITAASKTGGGLRLILDLSPLDGELALGESVCVNGACLTISSLDGKEASFDAVEETISRTSLASLKAGDLVNAERALRVGDRLGGHFVSGHIDGTGILRNIRNLASSMELTVECDPAITDMLIEKGSVALEGASLTLTDVKRGKFSVAIIPHTLEVTTLGDKKTGAALNVEVDMLGKWVKKLLGSDPAKGSGITGDFLSEHGFS